MSKIVVISPHVPKYKETTGKSALSSLANQGYIRVPGTGKAIIPHKEASGAYRTGLDEKANYIKHLSPEARDTLNTINTGVDFLFCPNSKLV